MDPACPFETPLSLSERDRRSMQRLAQRCIDETMVDYEHVLSSKSGLPNVTRWKPVKKKENIVVYEDQLAIEEIKRRKRKSKSLGDIIESNRVGDILTKSVGPGTFRPSATAFTRETEVSEPKEMPKMIWMGTVECELDDLIMASFATIEAASAVNKAAKCARKRKLNWLLATAETNSTNYSSVECNDSCCSVCARALKHVFGPRSFYECHICTKRVCHRCHVRQRLSFIKPDKNSFVVKQKALDLCTRCVHTATQMNARRVALEERAREHPDSMYKYVRRQKQSSLEESSCFEEFDLSKATEKDIEDCPSPRTVLLDRATQGLHRLF
ncbi:hypothetical protein PC115_g22592 [Phytophthora cactorum]|uniref:FYVE-type domain-containing protein n=1 Tax=Phytophthora cactorum TaxID=29920 RepID=A0A8T1AIJ2_9STRA|nr:hypothetical protein PC115_g22592 [Phytophthora cactorum]